MDEYLSDTRDRNITKQTKKKGRTLRVFADTPWHVKNSMVYAILDSEDLMRVEVIFRGSSSGFDWRKNVRIAMVGAFFVLTSGWLVGMKFRWVASHISHIDNLTLASDSWPNAREQSQIPLNI